MHLIRGMLPPALFLTLSVLLAPLSDAFAQSSAADCSRINNLQIQGVSTIDASLVEAGGLTLSDGNPAPGLAGSQGRYPNTDSQRALRPDTPR